MSRDINDEMKAAGGFLDLARLRSARQFAKVPLCLAPSACPINFVLRFLKPGGRAAGLYWRAV